MSPRDEVGPTAAELVEAMAPLQRQIAAHQASLAALVAAYADRRVADDADEHPPDLARPDAPGRGSSWLTRSAWP